VGPGKLRRLIEDPCKPALLRGELWVNPGVLSEAGFDRGPLGLVRLASSIGADVCFFHWPESGTAFDLKELAEPAHLAGLDCGLTIDGPFQRLAAKGAVTDILLELGRDPSGFRRLVAREAEGIIASLSAVEESGMELVVIGEDLGYAGGLYFSPEVFRACLLPFYEGMVGRLSLRGIALGWHSDGDVAPLLPDLVTCGFRFFSLEPECVDLLNFKRTHGPRVALIGGIRTDWLVAEEPDRKQQAQWIGEIRDLAGEGGLILASCCGIHNPLFLSHLKRIYRLIDGV
jgi:hypothetical protein